MNLHISFRLLIAVAIVSGFAACSGQRAAVQQSAVNNPSEAVARLQAGNERYRSGKAVYPNADQARRTETAPHQAPFAAVVGCSDSRVPVELIFDQGIGDLFVIRTAGNNVKGTMVMGSVDYAVKHLGVKLILVLGHSCCGGVTAAVHNEAEDGAVEELVAVIRSDVREYVGKTDCLDDAIRQNAWKQVDFILSHPHIRAEVEKGNLQVLPAFYDIENGRVEFTNTDPR